MWIDIKVTIEAGMLNSSNNDYFISHFISFLITQFTSPQLPVF